MERRDFLYLLSSPKAGDSYPTNPPSALGLDMYTGEWGFAEASHLLRRLSFGPSLSDILQAEQMTMNEAVDMMLADQPLPFPPLNADYPEDQSTPVGESWVGKPLNVVNKTLHTNKRRAAVLAWNREVIFIEGLTIREKMTLFWHNHFATGGLSIPEAAYRHLTLLRTHALGNFRQLAKDVTVDARMLRYLNGNKNNKNQPNENYARELLELFTVGKGPQIAPGNYTNYTEDDVVACAKILTGWKIKGQNSSDATIPLEVYFKPTKHSPGQKILSSAFGNVTIEENGANEYKDLIDVIFQQEAVAKFIVTKLYRFFVYYDITPSVQSNVINPLTQLLIDSDYEIKPVLAKLFKSEHFFDVASRGCLLKHPIDFLESFAKQLEWPVPEELDKRYRFHRKYSNYQINIGMRYLFPPSVAGWKAYYQSPSFHRIWINPASYQARNDIKNTILSVGVISYGTHFPIDLIGTIQQTTNPSSPTVIVDELTKVLLPVPISNSLRFYLKTILIPGLPDSEWTVEYNNYLANPNDEAIRMSIEAKIRALLQKIIELPEFQLS